MRFQVPQNVQREDQILGPLTFKQLIIAAAGLGIGWVIWTTLDPTVGTPLIVILVGLTICNLFVRINEMPFYQYVAEVALFLLKPRVRAWQKGTGEISAFEYVSLAHNRAQMGKKSSPTHKAKQTRSLREMSAMLDTKGRWRDKDMKPTKLQEEIDSLDDAEFFGRTMGV